VLVLDSKKSMYGNYLRDVEYGRNHSRNNGHFGLHVSKLA